MMGILKIVSKVFSFIKDLDIRVILVVVCFALMGFGYWQYQKNNDLQSKLDTQKHNIEALRDSTRSYKTKTGELGKEKLALQTDVEQLELANQDLAEELKKERDNVRTITTIQTVIKHDSSEADSRISEIGMSQYRIDWSHTEGGDGWSRDLKGYVSFRFNTDRMTPVESRAVITTDRVDLSIVTGIREDGNGRKTIFVRSNNPYVDFVEINGAVINQNDLNLKPKRWGIGLSLGYAVTADGSTTPYVGLGINFNFIRW